MEKMAYPLQVERETPRIAPVERPAPSSRAWRDGLPVLTGELVTLRELESRDAPALCAALSNDRVTRFLSPPPATIEGFQAFIALTHRQREAGQYLCFAVIPRGADVPIGMFQVRALEPSFATAEWGFVLASEFWGSGAFADGARLLIDFVFEHLGAHRLEARAALKNGRGNGALKKLGAVMEGVLRRAFLINGEYFDQALWAILSDEWRGRGRAQDVVLH